MEFKDAVKYLRSELGLTQIELATALHVNPITIGRWESGRTQPTRSITAVLMDAAQTCGASDKCLSALRDAIASAAKTKLRLPPEEPLFADNAALRRLVDGAMVPIYVCDLETDELLYLNERAQSMLVSHAPGQKCYQCLMNRDTRCDFCRRERLTQDRITTFDVQLPGNETGIQVHARRVTWAGRPAQVRYFARTDIGDQLKAIVENMNAGVSVVVYAAGTVKLAYANDHYYTLFGYTKEQFSAELTAAHEAILPEDTDYAKAMIESVLDTGRSVTFRYRIRKRDGSVAFLNCSVSISSIAGLGDRVMVSVLTDVSASVQSEQQALVFGQRLNAIMDNINSGVAAIQFAEDGSIGDVFVTDRYYEIMGYTREQYLQEVHDPFHLICEEDRERVWKKALLLQAEGDQLHLQYRATRRDGAVICLSVDATQMFFADVRDRPVLLCVFTDITTLMEANELLSKQRDQISEMLNTTPSGIAVVELDPDHLPESLHTTYYNDRFISFSGYSREEYDALLRTDEMRFVFEEDVPTLLADTKKVCLGELGCAVNTTIRCHTKDGGYRWLLMTGQLAERREKLCIVKISMVDITPRKEAEDRLRISEEMLRIAAESDQRALISYDIKANTCRVESHSLYAGQFGEVFENIPEPLIDAQIVAPDSVDTTRRLFERLRAGEERIMVSMQLRTGADEYQWFECTATAIFDADGAPDHAVLVFHNITEQRVKEAVFRKWQQSIDFRPPQTYSLFRCNLSRAAELDAREGALLEVQFPEACLPFADRTKFYTDRYVYPEDREAFLALLDSDTLLAMFYRGEHAVTMEYRELTAEGDVLWRRLTVETVEYLCSTDVQAFLLFEDIDERKRAELEARKQAETDPLTGALNRAAFEERVAALLQDDPASRNAMLILDMDGFKQLNDTFGHAAGDQALQDVTAVLRSFTHSNDLVCRLGGDEFLVWLHQIPYDAVISKTAQQLCAQIRKAYSQEVLISASVGIAVYPRDGHEVDELYRRADRALYHVKQSGKGSYAFYSQSTEEQTPEVTAALSTVRQAPRVDSRTHRRILIVDDSETSRILLKGVFKNEYLIETARNGTEAMIRLRHFGTSISVVLLDLMMPGMDGFEVLQKIQSSVDLRTIPVIVVTGDEERDTLLKAVELGAADYITKPVDVDIIRLRVQSAISKAENERLRAQNSYLQLQREEEMKFRTVLESTGTVVIEYDWRNHVFLYDSEISKHIAGNYDHRGLWRVFLSDMVADSADVKSMQEMLLSLSVDRGNRQVNRLVQLKTPSDQKHWFRMNLYKSEDAFGLAEKMILTFNDVHEEVLANEKLRFQATRDALTGLYNRAGFMEKAAELIAEKPAGYYIMACIDIERFKVINDQYGATQGDAVLRRFAKILAQLHHNEAGVCCRVMADHFAVLYPQQMLEDPAFHEAHRRLSESDGVLPPLKYSVGRYLVDDKHLPISAVYDRAAIAKDTIKGRYDTGIATYDESMRRSILRQQEITSQMKAALTDGQFEVWLQPQFNHTTGALSGAEALVRWRHPTEGIISPAEFIPIFERNGFVYELDRFVWEQTCILLRRWLDEGKRPAPVSVNISRYDLFRENLCGVICALIEKYRLPKELLRLEITESAFTESAEQIIRVVEQLVALGFVVEIDDFGSGYSSLNTLKDVPAQVLKMDMRFLENDRNAQRGGSIIESVVRMARWLGMSVIAEGVETMTQAEYLKSIGCEYIQGFLYSRPRPVAEYEPLLTGSRREAQASQLQTAQSWNNNAFWNPESMETLIFNSYVGGACIFEAIGGRLELLRYNDSFRELFHSRKYLDAGSRYNLLSLLDQEGHRQVCAAVEEAVTASKGATREIRVTRLDGTILFIRFTLRQIARASDRGLFYCVVSDITALRKAQRKEAEVNDTLRTVLANVDNGITAVAIRGEQTQFLMANDKFYQIHGLDGVKFTTPSMLECISVVHPDDRREIGSVATTCVRMGQQAERDYRVCWPDGTVRWVKASLNVTEISGIDAPVQITVYTDITPEKEARLLLQFLNQMAQDILAQPDSEAAIQDTLRKLLCYYQAERCCLVELTLERKGTVYEVCADGIPSMRQGLQSIPVERSAFWQSVLSRDNCLVIEDTAAMPEQWEQARTRLTAFGISSLILTPLHRAGERVGFVGLGNPSLHRADTQRMTAVGDYLSALLFRRDAGRSHDNG